MPAVRHHKQDTESIRSVRGVLSRHRDAGSAAAAPGPVETEGSRSPGLVYQAESPRSPRSLA